MLRISPSFFEDFCALCFLGKMEIIVLSPLIPTIFQCQIPGKSAEEIHQSYLESVVESNNSLRNPLRAEHLSRQSLSGPSPG